MEFPILFVLLLVFALIGTIAATTCEDKDAAYQFTECASGGRKVIFYWTNPDCTNQPPAPIDNISCGTTCEPGPYLTYQRSSGHTVCEKCPSNTYSTGHTFRISASDSNLIDLPHEATRNCFWIQDNKYWVTAECASFITRKDNSSLIMNTNELRDKTWNILEFKTIVHLAQEGVVKFTYRKTSRQEVGYINGRFRFFIGAYLILQDDDPSITTSQTIVFNLKKGPNELAWRYAVNTFADYTDLYAELIVCFQYITNCVLEYRSDLRKSSSARMQAVQTWK